MNSRLAQRTKLGLTQPEAALKAGLSLATWRRWEENPDKVKATTRRACERVLEAPAKPERDHTDLAATFQRVWHDSRDLTPRQAYAVSAVLSLWSDTTLPMWFEDPRQAPLHETEPFNSFDLRVMMLVAENPAWAEAVRRRCYMLAEEIESGVLPVDRPGPFIDEILVGAAIRVAPEELASRTELGVFDDVDDVIPVREVPVYDDDETFMPHGDDEWERVEDSYDDRCQWDDWEVPLRAGHLLLPAILALRHPFTWFDEVPASGPGFLQELAGLDRS